MSRYPRPMPAVSDERILFRGHPSWRSMVGFHLKWFVLSVVAGVLAGVLSAAITRHTGTGWVVIAVLLVFGAGIALGLVRRRRTTYTITTQSLTVEVGLLGREIHRTRLEQIQNVGASQSLLERALGVGSVCFDTAGGGAFDFAFRGVADPRRIVSSVDDALRHRAPSPVGRG